MLTDFHCHLQSDCFREDLPEVVFRAKKQGITRFFCNSATLPDWRISEKIAKQFKNTIISCFGIHPLYVEERHVSILPKLLPFMLLRSDKEHGIKTPIGEIGLDRFEKERDDQLQEMIFRTQLKIAQAQKRVVMLHTRKALDRVIEILLEEGHFPALLFHGFSGPKERIDQIIDLGGYFSFSANILKENHKKTCEMAVKVPLDRILFESDAPYMPPPLKMWPEDWPEFVKPRNEPAIIMKVAKKLAEIKKIPENDLIKQIQANESQFMRHISN